MISLLIFISIILLPWWVYLPMLFMAMVLIPNYWPAIILGFLVDTLYGQGILTGLISFLILMVLMPIRDRIRFYV